MLVPIGGDANKRPKRRSGRLEFAAQKLLKELGSANHGELLRAILANCCAEKRTKRFKLLEIRYVI